MTLGTSQFPLHADSLPTSLDATSSVPPDYHPTLHNNLAAAVNAIQTFLLALLTAGWFNGSPVANAAMASRTVTGTGAINPTDGVLKADATVAVFTLTLPDATGATVAGRSYWVKKMDAAAHNVTVQGTGGQTIDGAANVALTTQYQDKRFYSDGANWLTL